MYTEADRETFVPPGKRPADDEVYRTPWRKDAGRILHSPCFRRLQGKTQLFPGFESDFFRNRLTHSLEVGQIAKSIAIRLNATEGFLKPPEMRIDPDLAELAGWCHDLGHPPFGHSGELALDQLMRDMGGFEGNGQTLRMLCRLEKRQKKSPKRSGIADTGSDERYGLNLTFRSLATCLKYDKMIPKRRPKASGLVKGYYAEEQSRVQRIKQQVTGEAHFSKPFKVIECYIMDIADDIAYSTYDLEDAFKARFLSPFDLMTARDEILQAVAQKVTQRSGLAIDARMVQEVLYWIFGQLFPTDVPKSRESAYAYALAGYASSRDLVEDGYLRTRFTSQLIGEFIGSVELVPNEKTPALSEVRLGDEGRLKVEVLKNFTYQSLILAPDLQVVRHRGQEIVKRLFARVAATSGAAFLPADFRGVYEDVDPGARPRVVCDFIAGMTDQYAVEYYSRLFSESPQTIFKRV